MHGVTVSPILEALGLLKLEDNPNLSPHGIIESLRLCPSCHDNACHASHIPTRSLWVDKYGSEAVVDWLVAKKHLAVKERENSVAIKHAIESLLSAAAKAAACDVVAAIPQTSQGQRARIGV